jgi:hypothetical protein
MTDRTRLETKNIEITVAYGYVYTVAETVASPPAHSGRLHKKQGRERPPWGALSLGFRHRPNLSPPGRERISRPAHGETGSRACWRRSLATHVGAAPRNPPASQPRARRQAVRIATTRRGDNTSGNCRQNSIVTSDMAGTYSTFGAAVEASTRSRSGARAASPPIAPYPPCDRTAHAAHGGGLPRVSPTPLSPSNY